MKTMRIYLALVLLSFVAWSCSTQSDTSSAALKSSINSGAQSLTTAMNAITSSAGYQVLTSQMSSSDASNVKQLTKGPVDSTYSTYSLTDISGVYDYKAANYKKWNPSLLRFFVRTADNADMIVRLPESKVKNPGSLQHYKGADSTLVNNYVIDVSEYYYHFNKYRPGTWFWIYKMASNISIKGVSAGNLAIQSSNSKTNNNFVSSFDFANGYTANTTNSSGDTIISVYNISKANQTLYEEKYTAIKIGTTSKHREKEYSLTIGNVQILRKAGPNSLDSAKVYVNGVLQLHSIVKIVTDSTASVTNTNESTVTNHNRTIQITFDDGTTTTIKALLGSTIDNIQTLFATLRQAYFATNVVDWIAWDLYINKK